MYVGHYSDEELRQLLDHEPDNREAQAELARRVTADKWGIDAIYKEWEERLDKAETENEELKVRIEELAGELAEAKELARVIAA